MVDPAPQAASRLRVDPVTLKPAPRADILNRLRQAIRALDPRAAFRPFPILIVAAVLSTGCLSETRRVADLPPVTLQKATLDDLTEKLRQIAAPSSMKATVLLELTILNDDRTKEKEYKEVRGAVVARRPGSIRVQAQVPVTGQRAFDMASDGSEFQVYLPWRNRVYEGLNALDVRSEKRSENIRPQHILEPLLIDAPREDEQAVLLNAEEGRSSYQVVQLLRESENGGLWIARSAWFDRVDLRMDRYVLYNEEGDVMTRAQYGEWQDTPEGPRPGVVNIARPADGYDLSVRFIKPGWNEEVVDTAFDLEAPDGVEIVPVGEEDPANFGQKVGGDGGE